MIKKGIIFIVFLMFSTSIFCSSFKLEDYFKFDISTEFGIVNGTLGEYVFDNNCKNTDNMVSRLDWDIVTIPYGGVDVSIDLFKYVFLGFSGRMGIPVDSGYMQDYDWLNSLPPITHPLWVLEDPTELTNYSKHNNRVEKYYNMALKIGGNIPITRKFTITPYVGYEYDFVSMDAYNGYRKYKWENFQAVPFDEGKVISYAQEINQMIVGFEIDCLEIPKFPIFFDFHVVPGLGKFGALDIHHNRPYEGGEATAFLDVLSPIFLLDGKLSVYYRFNKYNMLGISSFIHFMPKTKGLNGMGPVKDGKLPSVFHGNSTGHGGASRFLYGVSLSYKFVF